MLQERDSLGGPIAIGLRVIKNRRIIRFVLLVAIVLGIAAGASILPSYSDQVTHVFTEHVQFKQREYDQHRHDPPSRKHLHIPCRICRLGPHYRPTRIL